MNDQITLIIDKIEKLILLVLQFGYNTLGLLVGPAILTGISMFIASFIIDLRNSSDFILIALFLTGPFLFILFWIDHARKRQGWKTFRNSILDFYEGTSSAFRDLLK
tara:strand:- start:200 stop:520 length:321 start_codon:yes stop_codon:yes gene_type:complete